MSSDDSRFFLSRRQSMFGSGAALAASGCRSSGSRPPIVAAPKQRGRNVINMDALVADCLSANKGADSQSAVKEVLARAIREPRALLKAVGEPEEAGPTIFHRSKELTIFAVVWTPNMTLLPHNHLMWGLIGLYTGREDNIFWRRTEDGKRPLEANGAMCLFEGDVAELPTTVIHSVTNPLERFTGGLHIYGGDFFAKERSQWDPETLEEGPSDGEAIRAMFERENARMRREKACR